MSAVAGADGKAQVVRERVDRGRWPPGAVPRRRRTLDRVVHAADDVGAPGHLRILDAEAGDARAAFEIDQEAGDIGGAEVDGEAERPAARRRKPDQLALAHVRAQRPIALRNAAGSCRAAARSTAGSGLASARITRSRSDRLSASVACGTLTSWLDHGRIEWQHFNGFAGVEFSPHHRRQRTRGNLDRAIGFRRDLAGAHPGGFLLPPARGVFSPASSISPSTTCTGQVPQVPRPPQAPMMRTPLRRAD